MLIQRLIDFIWLVVILLACSRATSTPLGGPHESNNKFVLHKRVRGLQTGSLPMRKEAQTGNSKCNVKVAGTRGGAAGRAKGCPSPPPPQGSPTPSPIVGECETSIGPLILDGSTTIASTMDAPLQGLQCETGRFGKGLFYTFEGTGDRIALSTCSNSTTFPAFSSLYQSADGTCDSLSCIATANTNVGGSCADGGIIFADTLPGTEYFLSVVGDNGGSDSPGPTGDVAVSISGTTAQCASALSPLATNGTLTIGSTVGAGSVGPQCGNNYWGPGIWFKFIGTGRRNVITTCQAATSGPTAVTMYRSETGGCDDLECVVTRAGDCSVLFQFAERNVTYYLSVIGNNDNGPLPGPAVDFGLRITSSETGCADAIGPLLLDGTVTEGSTFGAPRVGPQCLRNFYGPGLWYSFIGTGFRVVVTTCHEQTTRQTVISLHSSVEGNCNTMTCVNFNDGPCSTLFWNTRVGIVYYLSVLGSNNNGIFPGPERNFGLSVLSTETGCDEATPLTVDGPTVIFNSAADSGMIGPQCGRNVFGRGSYFSFLGTGSRISVDTCSLDSSIPHHVAVYNSTDGSCTSLMCVTSAFRGADGLECTMNEVVLDTVDGITYYVSIVGSDGPSNNPGPTGSLAISLVQELQ